MLKVCFMWTPSICIYILYVNKDVKNHIYLYILPLSFENKVRQCCGR